MPKDLHYTKLNESGKFFRDWGTHTDTLDIASTGLLQQELDTKLQFCKTKQQEVVAKLSILRKNKKYPKEVQNYVAQYQQDAYKNRTLLPGSTLEREALSGNVLKKCCKMSSLAY